MRFAPLIFSALLGCAATAAQAELPEGARAMIDAAIASGDERKVATVIGLARSTWPEERSTIDAINDQWKITLAARRAAEAEAEQTALINAGMFDRWSGEGELGAFQSSGNTESVGVAAALRLDREGIDWTHSIRLRADYQRQNGSTSREQFAASYEPRWQFDENIFAYGLAQYERDRIQGFSSRYSVSGGFGYRVIDNPKLKLSLKAGPAYRVTDFTDGTSADRLAGLVGLDFDWQMLDWAEQIGCPAHVLLTKADKLKRGPAANTFQQVRKELPEGMTLQLFSATKRDGVEEARVVLDGMLAD